MPSEVKSLSLEGGWQAFAADVIDQDGYRPDQRREYRQAFKNGAAAVVSRGETRGADAVAVYAHGAIIDVLRDIIHPMWLYSRAAHPGWGQIHCDACVTGALSAMVLFVCGKTLTEIGREIHAMSLDETSQHRPSHHGEQ